MKGSTLCKGAADWCYRNPSKKMHTRRCYQQQRSGNAAYQPIKSLLLNFNLLNATSAAVSDTYSEGQMPISMGKHRVFCKFCRGNVCSPEDSAQTRALRRGEAKVGRRHRAAKGTSTNQMESPCPQRYYVLKKRAHERNIMWTVRGCRIVILIWVLLNTHPSCNRKVK